MAESRAQRAWEKTALCMELQCDLNSSLLQGRKMTIQLNGHIRKLKSVQAMVLMRKHTTKQAMDEYVSLMSENLLSFKSEMLVQLDTMVKQKFSEIAAIKEGLEEDIETLGSLCEETEKLLQFDRDISANINKAHTLQNGFRMLLNALPAAPDVGDIAEFGFLPSVNKEEISPALFGSLTPSPNGDTNSGEAPKAEDCENRTVKETNELQKDSGVDENVAEEQVDSDISLGYSDTTPDPETVIHETVITKRDACINTDIRGDMLDAMSEPVNQQTTRLDSETFPLYLRPPPLNEFPNQQTIVPARSDGLHVAYVPTADLARQFAFNNQMFPLNTNVALNVMNPMPLHSIPLPAGTPPPPRLIPYPQNFGYPMSPFPQTLVRNHPPQVSTCTYTPLRPVPNIDNMQSEATSAGHNITPPGITKKETESKNIVDDTDKCHSEGTCSSSKESKECNSNKNSELEIVWDCANISKDNEQDEMSVLNLEAEEIQIAGEDGSGDAEIPVIQEDKKADIEPTIESVTQSTQNDSDINVKKLIVAKESKVTEDSKAAKESKVVCSSLGEIADKLINCKKPEFEDLKKSKRSPGSVKRFVSIFENKIHQQQSKTESSQKSISDTDKHVEDKTLEIRIVEKETGQSQSTESGDILVAGPSTAKENNDKHNKTDQISSNTKEIKDKKSNVCENGNCGTDSLKSHLHTISGNTNTEKLPEENETITYAPDAYLPPTVKEKSINDLESSTDEEEVYEDVSESLPNTRISDTDVDITMENMDGKLRKSDILHENAVDENSKKESPKKLEDYIHDVKKVAMHGKLSEEIKEADVKVTAELVGDDAESQVLCKTFGSEFRKRVKEGELMTPIKPLRRPLTIPRSPFCMSVVKNDPNNLVEDGHQRSLESHTREQIHIQTERCSESNDDWNKNNNLDSAKMSVMSQEVTATVKTKPVSTTHDQHSGKATVDNNPLNSCSSNYEVNVNSIGPLTAALSVKVEPESPTDNVLNPEGRVKSVGGTFCSPGSESNIEVKPDVTSDQNLNSVSDVKAEKFDTEQNTQISQTKTATDRNKETVQSQAVWCKHYLKRTLSQPKKVKTESESSGENWDLEIETDGSNGGNSVKPCSSDCNKDSTLNYDAQPFIPTATSERKIDNVSSVSKSGQHNNSKPKTLSNSSYGSEESWDLEIENEINQTNVEADSARCDSTAETNPKPVGPSKEEKLSQLHSQTTTLKKYVKNIVDDAVTAEKSQRERSKLGPLQQNWLKDRRDVRAKLICAFGSSKSLHYPIGVTTNSHGEIIIADTGNHNMKVYSSDGGLLKVFGEHLSPNMRRPSAAVVNSQDDVFVKDDICIRVFDPDGNFLRNMGDNLFVRPFGLGMTTTGNLVVLDTNPRRPTLVHISQDGEKTNKYLYDPLVGALPTSKCRFLAVSENHVFVSDLGLSQLYMTSLQGQFQQVIGCHGAGLQQFVEPSGIAVDVYGNLVIGDSKNNRMQVYRHDGKYCGVVDFDDGIVRPSGVHLTTDNRLIVINFLHHTVMVYQLL